MDINRTSNEDLIAEFQAAAWKWLLEKNNYTLESLRDARKALLSRMNAPETGELLSIARDLSTMDCFWSASGHHEADCKCLSGRAERAVAAHTQKANSVGPQCNCQGEECHGIAAASAHGHICRKEQW